MTDITELAQRNELLIANGQQTADLLRHLADNEIDSDYFAVVSECESYGKETDAELSITEFALRAAGYVDALVEALEKAQHEAAVDWEAAASLNVENQELKRRIAELESKLANPVQLPHTNGYWTETEKAYEEAITLAKRQIRLAGFRCEGDE